MLARGEGGEVVIPWDWTVMGFCRACFLLGDYRTIVFFFDCMLLYIRLDTAVASLLHWSICRPLTCDPRHVIPTRLGFRSTIVCAFGTDSVIRSEPDKPKPVHKLARDTERNSHSSFKDRARDKKAVQCRPFPRNRRPIPN